MAVAAGIATGNTAEYVLVWLMMCTLLPGQAVRLERVSEVLALTAAAALAPSVAALTGTLSLCLGGVAPWDAFAGVVTTYWLGDSAGILMVAPFLLTWVHTGHKITRLPELTVAGLCAIGISAWVFSDTLSLSADDHVFAYAVFPFVVWGALRHGVRGAATMALLVAIPAVIATANGIGVFAGPVRPRACCWFRAL